MKKFLDKIKNHFEKKPENSNISVTNKEKKYNTEFLINVFTNKDKNLLDMDDIVYLDYYYNINSKSEIQIDNDKDNPILFVGVVSFHHKKGSIVEYIHPNRDDIIKAQSAYFKLITNDMDKIYEPGEVLDIILNQLTFQCLPDAVHTTDEDSQFFFIQNFNSILFGTSCYKQMKTKVTDKDEENTRDYIQKVIVIIIKGCLYSF